MAVDGSNSETSQSNSAEEISVGDMMGVAASTAAGERAGTSKRKKGGFSRSNLIQFFYNESYQTSLSLSDIQEMIVDHADYWHYKIYFI